MKVIEKGRPQKGWATELRCTGAGNGNGGCNAKLLVEIQDVFETRSNARDEVSNYTTFECPECHVWTDMKSKDAQDARQQGYLLPVRYPGDKKK